MKTFRKVTAWFAALMAAWLGVIIWKFQDIKPDAGILESYSAEELQVYKKIWSDLEDAVAAQQRQMLMILILFWAVIFLMGIVLMLAIYWIELKPIQEMESFAEEIAKGNLDTPLPIRRGTLFSNLTESFDVMREELKRSREREIAAEHAKREMVAELSHDLKTPVATIQATCEVLELIYRKKLAAVTEELDKAGKNGKEDLAELEESKREVESTLEKVGYVASKSETIHQLVQNVFRVTLDELDEIKVSVQEQSSGKIEEYFRNLKDYGNVILENHVPECLVVMDPLRMEQVIDNVVGNAYKYAGTDVHVSFEMTGKRPAADGTQREYLMVKIRDDGPGVSEEELPLVIEKYYRGENAKDKNGYGLGMYLVKWYMEKQGGGMNYYNDNGFVVELYVQKV